MPVGVVQLHVEGLQTPQHGEPDSTRGHRSHVHALDVIRTLDTVCDVPPAVDDSAPLDISVIESTS